MRKTTAVLPLLLALALAGCSSNDTAKPAETTPPTTTSVVPTTTTTPPAPVANDATLEACRGFADNPAIGLIRDTITTGADDASTADVADAFDALADLEETAATPGLAPDVATEMTAVAESAAAQQDVWVDTSQLDPIPFQRLITRMNSACETAGVDMA
jgi:hypothetical protein